MRISDFFWFLTIGVIVFTLWAWESENNRLKKTGKNMSFISFIKIRIALLVKKFFDLKISRWFLISTLAVIVFLIGLMTFVFMFRYEYHAAMNRIYKINRFTGATYTLAKFDRQEELPEGGRATNLQIRWIMVTPDTSEKNR